MVKHQLLKDVGILILEPAAPLEADDFEQLGREIDPYIEANGKLHGIMIDAAAFPGWKDHSALLAHLRFVKNHHTLIQKLAVVSDSKILTIAPMIASHFVKAEVKHFSGSHRAEAMEWLEAKSD